MLPGEWKSLEPREFAAWVKGRSIYLDERSQDKYDIMHVIRWGFGFLANLWTKKTVHIEKHYPMHGDNTTSKRVVIKKDDFDSLAKRYDDSANNR